MRALLLISLFAGGSLFAQTIIDIGSLSGNNGYNPIDIGTMVLAKDGNFYATANEGGANGAGTVFKMTPAGVVTDLYDFTVGNQGGPYSGLIQASDGNLYGTTTGGVFKITTAGAFTFFPFQPPVSGGAYGGVIQGSDGNLYGAIREGGANGNGAIFRMTLSGALTDLHDFNGVTEGSGPEVPPVQAADGNFYGTTCCSGVGDNASGMVYKMTPGGSFTVLHTFMGPDGASPQSALIQGTDGNFYGTTEAGGANDKGTIFKMTPGGAVTTLYSFSGSDGQNPIAGLLQASDGNFYGIALGGGTGREGTIFQITLQGAFTTLYNFNGKLGGSAYSGLIQGTDGNLYGISTGGGANFNGAIFEWPLASSNAPTIMSTGGVLNGASFQAGVAPNSWVTIKGTNLSTVTDTWANSIVNGALPTMLDGISVNIGGQAAYVYYVSPGQINVLAPNVGPGSASVTVTSGNVTSASVSAVAQAVQPAFFQWSNSIYAVATREDFSDAVKNGTIPGLTTTPAKPGDVLILWGTGFGATNPPVPTGMVVPSTTTYNTASPVTVTLGTTSATVYGAALAPGDAGLYQVAIQIPASLTDGDYPVVATVNRAQSPATALITVQQ